jgi:Holliday junction DNA helicase RuvB
MGLFESKEEKAFKRKQQTRQSVRKISKHIESLNKQRDLYIQRAKDAHLKGLTSSYNIARSGIKATMIQLKRAGEMQLNLELLMQQRDFAALSGSFVKGMDIVSKELIKETGKIDFVKISQQFNRAMGKAGLSSDNLEDMLDSNADVFSDISGTDSISDSDIDALIGIEIVDEMKRLDKDLDRLFGAEEKKKSGDDSFKQEMQPLRQSETSETQSRNHMPSLQSEVVSPVPVSAIIPTRSEASKGVKPSLNSIDGEPQSLSDFLGQDKAIAKLRYAIEDAKRENEDLEDVLLTGAAGLGKSTLATVIANEMGKTLIRQHASAIRSKNELTNLMKKIKKGDVVFIDEIHELSHPIQTALLDAMQDKRYSYSDGRGDKAYVRTIDIPSFTLIGATTHAGGLTNALKSRFLGNSIRLEPYDSEGLASIIQAQATKRGKKMDFDVALIAGELCRGTPRRAKKYAKHILQIAGTDEFITEDTLDKWREVHEIDSLGLLPAERKLLEILVKDYIGEPASASTLAGIIQEEEQTVVREYEPHLLSLQLIARTVRGRVALKKAFEHLGVPVPEKLAQLDESVLEIDGDDSTSESVMPKADDSISEERKYKRGERAELEVANIIDENFSSETYKVFHNLILKNGDRTVEIDHLLVSPYGVFVVETKDYKGVVEGFQNTDFFFQHIETPKATNPFRNPIKQNEGHIRALVDILGAYPYIGAVVFSDRCELKVRSVSFVGKISELVDYIKASNEELLNREQQDDIIAKINEHVIVGDEAEEIHRKFVEEQRKKK